MTKALKYSPKLLTWLLSLPLLLSCGDDRFEADVSDVQVNLEVYRMEQELFNAELNAETLNATLLKKYDFLYESFMMDMIGEGSPMDPMAPVYLDKFRSHPQMKEISESIQHKFKDFSPFENDLKEGFKHYKYFFPDSVVPRIVTFYSNFNASIFPYNSTLGIGLDMYLGEENEIVKMLPPDQFSQYMKRKMEPEYMVPDAMRYWLLNKFAKEDSPDFLSKIVALGKIMFLTEIMLPNTPEHLVFGCTESQLKWAKSNENTVWNTFVEQNVIYTKDPSQILQYVSEGPFTKGFPKDSPPKLGIWLGWQIVRDYMYYNEDVTIDDLLSNQSAKIILKSYSQGKRDE